MAKVHEQDHDEPENPDSPEPDLENHLPDDSYPMQDSDVKDLLETHSHYSAKMVSTYHISKHSASSYGSLVDRGANGGLEEAEVHVLERTGSKVSNSILAWLTANPPGILPQNTPIRWV